jgi:hypothetical protein
MDTQNDDPAANNTNDDPAADTAPPETFVPRNKYDRFIQRVDQLLSEGYDIAEVNLKVAEEFGPTKAQPTSSDTGLGEAQQIAKAAIDKFNAAAAEIGANEDLSEKGKQGKIDAVSTELLDRLNSATEGIEAARAEHQQVERKLSDLAKVDADSAQTAIMIERREALNRMKPEKRLETIAKARLSGDIETLRSVVGVPAYVLGLNDHSWKLCQDRLVELTGDGERQHAAQLGRSIDKTQRLVDGARSHLRRQTSREGLKQAGERLWADEMTPAQKAEFIRQHGLERWRDLVTRTQKK